MKTFFQMYLSIFAISLFIFGLMIAGATTKHDIGISPTEYKWDGRTLYLTGSIGHRTTDYIRNNKHNIDTLVLNSPGGKAQAGFEIAAILRTEGINTVVKKGDWCASACTIIFQGGKERYADKEAEFLYHAPYHFAYKTTYTWKSLFVINIKREKFKVFLGEAGRKRFLPIANFGLAMNFVKIIPLDREGEIRGTVANLYDTYGDIGLLTNRPS